MLVSTILAGLGPIGRSFSGGDCTGSMGAGGSGVNGFTSSTSIGLRSRVEAVDGAEPFSSLSPTGVRVRSGLRITLYLSLMLISSVLVRDVTGSLE